LVGFDGGNVQGWFFWEGTGLKNQKQIQKQTCLPAFRQVQITGSTHLRQGYGGQAITPNHQINKSTINCQLNSIIQNFQPGETQQ
jgi:hypothetical protein